MGQYKSEDDGSHGLASATPGSAVITGIGTEWLANAHVGDSFKFFKENAHYTIQSVNSNTSLTLTANYQGLAKVQQKYAIAWEFTSNGLYEISAGDADWAYFITQNMRKLASGILVGTADSQAEEDALWAAGYTVVVRTDIAAESGTPSTDTTPAAFTFADQTGVAVSTPIESNLITISGINSAATISVTNGEFSKNGGVYTSAAGTVVNGDTVRVKHTSSASNSTEVNTTLTVGGVSDTFTSTTVAAATDTTPNAFTFTDQTGVALNTVTESNTITVAGINAATAITVSNGEYSKNGGTYTASAGTVVNGDTVKVRHTSANVNTTAVSTILTIGGVSDTFTTTTVAAGDSTPNAFTFTDQTGVNSATVVESNTITVAGINVSTAISVTGGEYSKNGGGYTSSTGTVVNGDTVKVRQTSSASGGVQTNCTLTIGGVSDTFNVTTNTDTTPNAFTFVDQTGVAVSTAIESAAITVAGINSPATISVTGGEYNKNDGAYTAASGTVSNGDSVKVKVTSSASNSTAVSAILTIGGVSDTFTVTTTAAASDTTPDAFTFTDQTGVAVSTAIESNTITVAGINAATAISISGGTYSKNGGAYTSASGTVVNGDTVKVKVTSSASNSTAVNTTLTIGGISDTFTVTTVALSAPTQPVISVTPGDTTNVIALTSGGAGATSYDLKWGTVAGTRSNTITGVTLPYTHTGRTNGTTYYYSLVAINGAGSTESAEVSGTPVAVSTNYYTQNWDAAPLNATTYDGWISGTSGVGAYANIANNLYTSAYQSFVLGGGDTESTGTAWVERTMTMVAGTLTFALKHDSGSPAATPVKVYIDNVQVGNAAGYDNSSTYTLTIPAGGVIRFSMTSLAGAIHLDNISIPIP